MQDRTRNQSKSFSSWGRILKKGIRALGMQASNHRRYSRFDCAIPVEIHLDTPGQVAIINAVARNISAGGMLIRSSTVLDSLTPCHVSFRMPEWFPGKTRARDIMAYAHVRHSDPSDQFFGIAFTRPL